MSWNYRVIKHEDRGEVYYAVHEVYYKIDGKPHSWTKMPVFPIGASVEELRSIYADMLMRAFDRPILEIRDDQLQEESDSSRPSSA